MTGEEFRGRRLKIGLTIEELAYRFQVETGLVRQWEAEDTACYPLTNLLERALEDLEGDLAFEKCQPPPAMPIVDHQGRASDESLAQEKESEEILNRVRGLVSV